MFMNPLGPFGMPERVPRWGFPSGPLAVGYAWESVIPGDAPSLEEQMNAVQGCHKIFHDKITLKSGRRTRRTELWQMLDFLQQGDTVVVYNLGCLGTSAVEAINYLLLLFEVYECNLNIPGRVEIADSDTVTYMLEVLRDLSRADRQKDRVKRYNQSKRKGLLAAK